MQLKASTDYGLRAVLYLAVQGTTRSSKDIAHDMSIPRDYLIQLAQLLRNAGIIEAKPGKNGGYHLAKDPADITLMHVMSALEEESSGFMRERREERAKAPIIEGVRRAYEHALESYDAYFESITLADLLAA